MKNYPPTLQKALEAYKAPDRWPAATPVRAVVSVSGPRNLPGVNHGDNQIAHLFCFGRVYAAYGGVFIVLSILWGWKVDKISPDIFDIIGGLVALAGVGIVMYGPRG